MPFWLYRAVSGGGVSLAFQGLANSQVSYLPEAHWRSDDCEDPQLLCMVSPVAQNE